MIASCLQERTPPAFTTFDRSVPPADAEAVCEIVKDPFILDFLADTVRERDSSKALTDNLTRFLRELGTGFAFVGAEMPVQCGGREFFVDLPLLSPPPARESCSQPGATTPSSPTRRSIWSRPRSITAATRSGRFSNSRIDHQ
jgi:hypothetical protein